MLALLRERSVAVDGTFVRIGIVLHDAGTTSIAQNCKGPAANTNRPRRRCCSPRAYRQDGPGSAGRMRWATMARGLEELAVALADTWCKGARKNELEQRFIGAVAAAGGRER